MGSNTSGFRTCAIPTRIAESVRSALTSPFAHHPVRAETAQGYGPCRHCLRCFRVGEERRLLFTYDPFEPLEAPPLPGPVFIHESPCEPFPEDGGVPADLRSHPLTLNVYAHRRKLLVQEYVTGEDIDDELERLLALPGLAYIHVRDTKAGCYDFRIEPAAHHREGDSS